MRKLLIVFIMLVPIYYAYGEVLYIAPETSDLPAVGEQVTLEVKVRDMVDLYGIQIDIKFDPAVLDFVSAEEGDFLKEGGASTFFTAPSVNGQSGLATGLAIVRIGGTTPGVSGEGTIAKLTFQVLSHADTSVELVNVLASDPDANQISLIIQNASLNKPELNQPPQPAIQITGKTEVESFLTFDASGSVDPDGTIVDYLWDFGNGSTANGVTVQYRYMVPGTYRVVLTVTDDKGAAATQSRDIVITPKATVNEPPTASMTISGEFTEGETLTFDASGSVDPDGTIVSYKWDFGDGQTGSGAIVQHSYSSAGTFTVSMTVTDDKGASVTATKDIVVEAREAVNQPPVPAMVISGSMKEGNPITFDASTTTDPDGQITSYSWDFGDGSIGTGVTSQHTYAVAGTFVVKLTVTDDKGAEATLSRAITIEPQAAENQPPVPSIQVSGDQVVGNSVLFDGSGSIDPDGQIISYQWQFGDGGISSGTTVSHAYANPGTYVVKLTVTDDKGAQSVSQREIAIAAKPGQIPIAVFSVTGDLTVGEILSFDASASVDPDGQIVSYNWDFGDGTKLSGKQVNHPYSSAGQYTVKLTVKDNDGFSAETSRTLVIQPKLEAAIRKHELHSPTLMFSFDVVKANQHAHCFIDIWDGSFVIQPGQYLEYQIIFLSGGASYKGGVDLLMTDGTTLGTVRGRNGEVARDQFGIEAEVSADLSAPIEGFKHAALNRWYHRMIPLDLLAGKTLDRVMLGSISDSPASGEVSFFVDNIQITDGKDRLLDIYIDNRRVPIGDGLSRATGSIYLEPVNVAGQSVEIGGLPKVVHPFDKRAMTWAEIKARSR